MFKTSKSVQKDIFRDITHHVSLGKAAELDNPQSWHNIFYKEVLNQIDESIFSVLFDKKGRPNASIRVLLGMMILKEGNGWSDEQLFDNCRFNLRCMRALGLHHIDDDIPVESTYYEFRRRLSKHHYTEGIDLIKESFQGVSQSQLAHHNIKGDKIRLDSKLIQSNIAKSTRLDLILETVRKSISSLDLTVLDLESEQVSLLSNLKQKTVSNLTYPLSSQEKHQLLVDLGFVIKQLLPFVGDHSVLSRVYTDHYKEEEDSQDRNPQIQLKPAKEIKANSVQSIHDPEATFRSKGQGHAKKQVSGYHSNISETCNQDNAFNLITDLEVVTADVCEDQFLFPAIKQSEQVLNQTIIHVTTDGGYDSIANRRQMASNEQLHWNMAKHKGVKLRYKLNYTDAKELQVYCQKTNLWCEVSFSEKTNKYSIIHQDKSRRYFTKQQIQQYIILQEHHQSQNEEDINIRPNVESTIHQVFHRLLKRDKIKYRGIYKCKMYVVSRAYWTNFRRILKNESENALFSFFFLFLMLKSYIEPHMNKKQKTEIVFSVFEIE